MDMWQLIGLKKTLTVEEAAQLWTRTRHDSVAEGVIKDAIEAGVLAARIERWGVYYADLGAELPEGNINQHETTVKRTDLDTWLKAIGQSITGPGDLKPETDDEPQKVDASIVGAGATADGGDDWQTKCRRIADELHAKDKAAGAWSSVSDIADRVAPIAFERKIRGPHGQLTAANILREALQGEKWNGGRIKP